MKELKSTSRNPEKPLEQINNRFAEISFCKITSGNANLSKIVVTNPHKGPLMSDCFSPQLSKVKLIKSDNCYLMKKIYNFFRKYCNNN